MPVYHLNADFDYRQMQDFSRLDPDCLHTTLTTPLTMPKQVVSSGSHLFFLSISPINRDAIYRTHNLYDHAQAGYITNISLFDLKSSLHFNMCSLFTKFSTQVTSCVRTMAKTFTNPVDGASAFGVFFGTLLPVKPYLSMGA